MPKPGSDEPPPARAERADGRCLSTVSRRSVLTGAAALAGTGLLGACGRGGSGTPSTRNADTITVTDQRGKTLVFDGPVNRVVALPTPAPAMFVAVDRGPEHLVGMREASWTAMHQGIMGEMFPAALKTAHHAAREDFSPNVETILALKPDMVVQWGDHGSEIIAPMENAGLKVIGLTYGTQKDLNAWIRLFAAALGKPHRAQAMITRMRSQMKTIKSVASHQAPPKPRALYFHAFMHGLEVAAHNSYNDFYMGLVGARNAATGNSGAPGSGMVKVDVEQVLAWDPDIVLLGNFDDAMPDDIYSDKVWQDVAAVKSRRVYKIPLGGYRWDPPSQESPLMWQWLSQIAYPNQQYADLRSQISSDYHFLYGYHLSNAQIDEILWMDANSKSANYRQFGS